MKYPPTPMRQRILLLPSTKQKMPTAEDELIETSRDLYAKAVKASEDSSDIINKGEEFITG